MALFLFLCVWTRVAMAPTVILNDGQLFWRWVFWLTEPVNGVRDGTYDRLIDDPPENEGQVNAQFPAEIAALANLHTGTSQFSSNDVIGGRL